jgi:hypothetical protein
VAGERLADGLDPLGLLQRDRRAAPRSITRFHITPDDLLRDILLKT